MSKTKKTKKVALRKKLGGAGNRSVVSSIFFGIGDGSNSVSTGEIGMHPGMPCDYEIIGWAIAAKGSSPTCTVDLWVKAAGTAIPTVADTIMGTKPALASGNAVQSTTMLNWKSGQPIRGKQGDILIANLDAVSNATRVTIKFDYIRI